MKITAVRATWLQARIPPARAHVSDFGRNDSFNTCLVEVDTDAGLTGLGEAHELVDEPFELVEGCVLAPERAGLGLTLRGDFVRSIATG